MYFLIILIPTKRRSVEKYKLVVMKTGHTAGPTETPAATEAALRIVPVEEGTSSLIRQLPRHSRTVLRQVLLYNLTGMCCISQ